MTLSDEVRDRVIAAAREAARHAHAPYSRFAVGAAALLNDGSIVAGCNFENASYGLSLCAETVALAKANSEGRLADIVAIGVVGGPVGNDGRAHGTDPIRPCGRCRQVINESAQLGKRDVMIWCAGAEGDTVERHQISVLLPHAFGPRDLGFALEE